MMYEVNRESYLSHHGVKGQRWGVRRYQSYDTKPRRSGKIGKMIGLAQYANAKQKMKEWKESGDKLNNFRLSKGEDYINKRKKLELEAEESGGKKLERFNNFVDKNEGTYIREYYNKGLEYSKAMQEVYNTPLWKAKAKLKKK